MNSKLSTEASGPSVFFRLFVGLAALASGVMRWLWAGQQDQSWKYAPAIFCFCLAVAMCLPTPTGRVREMLSRSVGAVLILVGAAAAISVMLSRHGAEGLSVGKFVVGLVLAGIVIAIGWGQLFPNHYAPIPIDHDDPQVQEANEQARREIGRFREGVPASTGARRGMCRV